MLNMIAIQVIDALGGTRAVSKAIDAPNSTVHSWRTIGIPRSRMAHLKLLAEARGIEFPEIADEADAA